VRRRPKMTIAGRSEAVEMSVGGAAVKEIADRFRRALQGIRNLLKKHNHTVKTQEKPRSGHSKMISRHHSKLIYHFARKYPKIEYKTLMKNSVFHAPNRTPSKSPSCSTLYQLLKGYKLANHRCKKRLKLDRGYVFKRLKSCKEFESFNWKKRPLKSSDECSFQKGSGHNREWCFRFLWEKWKLEMIPPISTGRVPQQMVWASIWLDESSRPRRYNLVIMERDSDAP
jgi:hypothetical protein